MTLFDKISKLEVATTSGMIFKEEDIFIEIFFD